MTATPDKPKFNSRTARRVAVKVIAVGNAGANILSRLPVNAFGDNAIAYINTDAESIEQCGGADKFLLNSRLARGRNPESAVTEHLPALQKFFEGADAVFVVAGFGGVAGTVFGPHMARIAREAGALVLGVAVMPFDCEASRRTRASNALEAFKTSADAVISLSNQQILKLTDDNTSVLDTFKIANELLVEGIQSLWRMLVLRGLIEIHFSDIAELMRERRGESIFAVAEAAGANRSRDVIEKLLAHPMLNGGQTLADSQTVLVSLIGGPDLTMADVNRVMEQINRQCEQAKVIMGAAIDETFRDRLAVTLLATQRCAGDNDEIDTDSPSRLGSLQKNGSDDITDHMLGGAAATRSSNRIVPPAPETTPEKIDRLVSADGKLRRRKSSSKLRQSQLPLEIVSKGRFEKAQPTIHKGEDLDQPTYLRRGIALN